MIPVGNITAEGLPRSPATSVSSCSTAPRSPYRSQSMSCSAANSDKDASMAAGVDGACQKTAVLEAPAARNRACKSFTGAVRTGA